MKHRVTLVLFHLLLFVRPVWTEAQPTITSFAPIYGWPGGDSIGITGTGFLDAKPVVIKFNQVTVTNFYVSSSTYLTCQIKPGTSLGPGKIYLKVGSAVETYSSSDFTVIGFGYPFVSDFGPNVGGSGTLVTFNGKNLASATALFNGLPGV